MVTVRTHDVDATTRRREQQRATADIDALFGGPGPGHEVRWMWLLWAARVLLAFAVLAAVVGGAFWRSRVTRRQRLDRVEHQGSNGTGVSHEPPD